MRPQDYQAPDDLLRDKVILVTGAGDVTQVGPAVLDLLR